MLAVHASRIPRGSLRRRERRGEAGKSAEGRKKEEEEIRGTTTLYLTLHTGAPVPSCARRVVPLVLEFSGTSGVRVGLLPRSRGRARILQAFSTYSK